MTAVGVYRLCEGSKARQGPNCRCYACRVTEALAIGVRALERLSLAPIRTTLRAQAWRHGVAVDPGEPLVPVLASARLVIRPELFVRGAPAASRTLLLRRSAAERLASAAEAIPLPFTLVMTDSWRSAAAQRWLHDQAAARVGAGAAGLMTFDVDANHSHMSSVAPHMTGGAVDIALLGPGGVPWPMEPALPATEALEDLEDAPRAALLGRRLLVSSMLSAGFTNYPLEWWHYDFGNEMWRRYGRHIGCTHGKTL